MNKPKKWFRCKRCSAWVLSYKHTRGIHNKKCPPNRDNDAYADSFLTRVLAPAVPLEEKKV